MTAPLRDVASFVYCGACRYTGYRHCSIRLTLSCGHEQIRKKSGGVPRKARCRECERDARAAAPRITVTFGPPIQARDVAKIFEGVAKGATFGASFAENLLSKKMGRRG